MVGYKRDRNTQNPHTQSHIQTYVPGVEGFWEIKGDAAKRNTQTHTQKHRTQQQNRCRKKDPKQRVDFILSDTTY
jgi:hypothetical protein